MKENKEQKKLKFCFHLYPTSIKLNGNTDQKEEQTFGYGNG